MFSNTTKLWVSSMYPCPYRSETGNWQAASRRRRSPKRGRATNNVMTAAVGRGTIPPKYVGMGGYAAGVRRSISTSTTQRTAIDEIIFQLPVPVAQFVGRRYRTPSHHRRPVTLALAYLTIYFQSVVASPLGLFRIHSSLSLVGKVLLVNS